MSRWQIIRQSDPLYFIDVESVIWALVCGAVYCHHITKMLGAKFISTTVQSSALNEQKVILNTAMKSEAVGQLWSLQCYYL